MHITTINYEYTNDNNNNNNSLVALCTGMFNTRALLHGFRSKLLEIQMDLEVPRTTPTLMCMHMYKFE